VLLEIFFRKLSATENTRNKHQRREQWQWSAPERESNHFIIVLLELLLEVWSKSIRRIFPTRRGAESNRTLTPLAVPAAHSDLVDASLPFARNRLNLPESKIL
jgi:hypothetical protein